LNCLPVKYDIPFFSIKGIRDYEHTLDSLLCMIMRCIGRLVNRLLGKSSAELHAISIIHL
jgi:hypothetical protein